VHFIPTTKTMTSENTIRLFFNNIYRYHSLPCFRSWISIHIHILEGYIQVFRGPNQYLFNQSSSNRWINQMGESSIGTMPLTYDDQLPSRWWGWPKSLRPNLKITIHIIHHLVKFNFYKLWTTP
jgi:hypothetical protein